MLIPTTAGADHTGSPIKISGAHAGEDVLTYQVIAGGDFVMYSVRDASDHWNAYAVPVGGGPVFQVNPPGTELQALPEQGADSHIVVYVVGTFFTNEETWATNLRTQTRTKLADGPGNELVIVDTASTNNGKWAAIYRASTSPTSITVHPTAGGPGTKMGPLAGAGDLGAVGMQFSDDSKYLVYTMRKNGQYRLFSYRLSDGVRAPLNAWSSDYVGHTLITADSQHVIYTHGSSKLKSVGIDGSNATTLFSGPSDVSIRSLTSDPTSNRVVFLWDNGNSERLRAAEVGVAGSAVTLVTDNLGRLGTPTVSPDGQWVVLEVRDCCDAQVYSVPIAGSTPVRLNQPLGTRSARFHDISPDSSHVLMSYEDGDAIEVPVIVPIGGGQETPLVTDWPNRGELGSARFYPLGGDVIFSARLPNAQHLYRVPTVTGGPAHRLSNPAVDNGAQGLVQHNARWSDTSYT